VVDLNPGAPFTHSLTAGNGQTSMVVLDNAGNELISYAPKPPKNVPLPETAKPPKLPHQIESLEELYLTGLHIEQYLHFSLDPVPYWARALELDPSDSRSNNALGRLLLRRGDFMTAENHFRTAIKALTQYNFNPFDGEPHYNLGLALAYQGNFDEAYDHFYKSTWCYAQRSAGYFALGQIDIRRGNYGKALDHLDRALVTNAHNNKARTLKAVALRKLGDKEAALKVNREALAHDPLDLWANSELAILTDDKSDLTTFLRGDVQNYLDLAFDCANAGLFEEASEILQQAKFPYPMVYYALGYFADQLGDAMAASEFYIQGAAQPPDYCFPLRLEEQIILKAALKANPTDGKAAYYLGNLHYDKRQYEKAIDVWKVATKYDPGHSIPWRNLGIALYNKRGDKEGAKRCYDQALAANAEDPRLLMEMDQLLQRLGSSQDERLAALEKQADLVERRDDLSITFAELYSQTGQPERALEILTKHEFHAWEGGEGGAAGQYAFAQGLLGQAAAEAGNLEQALEHYQSALSAPDNLGVGRGMSMYDVLSWFNTAETLNDLGDSAAAKDYYQKIIDADLRFSRWGGASPLTYYAALAFKALGQPESSDEKLTRLEEFAQQKLESGTEAGFFTSKPSMVVFDDDPQVSSQIEGHYLMGLAQLGQGKSKEAKISLKSVLHLDPHNWWAKFHLASI
jgi:tetratricopeptide (TPR) repeat protein